ncbi:hypothetical protein [Aquabacterium sp.]|uniref:hypothetical protein n=1 Tax=Aquabacterium sp. TaxID=1872578 RepID=UPI003B752BCD
MQTSESSTYAIDAKRSRRRKLLVTRRDLASIATTPKILQTGALASSDKRELSAPISAFHADYLAPF